MSHMPKLDGAPINLAALREHSRQELMAALDSVSSPEGRPGKALVLDPALSGPLGLIAEVKEFKEHGVEKIYHLLAEPLASDARVLLFFVRPTIELAERVAAQVQQLERARAEAGGARRSYHLFFVPRRSMVCERVLQEEGVYGMVTVRELGAQLIPLEDDVLSLEQPCFKELFLDDERSILYSVASGIMKLQAMFGPIPLVRGKGDRAHQVLSMLQQMRRGLEADGQLPPRETPGEIGALLLLDRDVDLVTPMCTELTYEGLLNAVFGIAHGYVDLAPEVLGGAGATSAPASGTTKREMNNNDPLYRLTRSINFGELGPLLNRLAKETSAGYDERHNAHTVSQIKDFMKKLHTLQHQHKSLGVHVGLAERIQKLTNSEAFRRRLEAEQTALGGGGYPAETEALLEDMIARGEPLHSTLRLACLLSLVNGGIRPKALASLQTELLQQHGYEKVAHTLPALHKVGLLREQVGLLREQAGRGNSWPALRKALHLVVDEMPEHEIGAEPADMAYVYSGYAPLSVRVLGLMSRAGWPAKEEMLRALPGRHFEATQAPARRAAPAGGEEEEEGELLRQALQGAPEATPPPPLAAEPARPLPTLVFFIGGCTFAELAAVRWLGRHESPPREYIVATTHLCSGDDLVRSLITSLENNLTRL